MEQAILAFWINASQPSCCPPYQAAWYAAWNALARFPDDPRSAKWRWKMAYYMALAGEGDEATEIYADLIADALNRQKIKPQDLPDWFQSGELNYTYLTQGFTLEFDPMEAPGNDAGYLIRVGSIEESIDTPGGSCILIIEDRGKFTPYIIHNGFPEFGFFIMLRNPFNCFAKDVTDDGVDEIIFEQYTGGHVGVTDVSVFDITTLPPKEMRFLPSQDAGRTWGHIEDYPIVNGKTHIQLGISFSFVCNAHGMSDYQWNGEWFEITKGQLRFSQSAKLSSFALSSCYGSFKEYVRNLNFQNAISILDNVLKTYAPYVIEDQEMLEEFRVLAGLYRAFGGDDEAARSVFEDIVNSPIATNSPWIDPAQEFLNTYQTPTDLYQACSKVNIWIYNYEYRKYYESRPCDHDVALQAVVATSFSLSPLTQLIANLKSVGVHITSDGWYDFDGDGRNELWFTVIHPGENERELWIAVDYSQGVKALLVSRLPGPIVTFKPAKNASPKVRTDFGSDQTIELVRHPLTREPFVVVRDEAVDPIQQDLAQFKELRQMLYQGSAAAPIYERMLEIDRRYPNCPFETKNEYYGLNINYDCASFYYTLAFAAELAGKENEAVKRYYRVWSMFPESPLAELARLKLEQ